jgi:DNA-binding FadR family transcriptional regulator
MEDHRDLPTPGERLARVAASVRDGLGRARPPEAAPRRRSATQDVASKTAAAAQSTLDERFDGVYSPINRINQINRNYMLNERTSPDISEFLRYLAAHPEADNGLPPLNDLSRELGISLGALREQLEVARALGLVDIKPRTGTRRRPFSFAPAVRQSLTYALALSDGHFDKFADLRNHLEGAYWFEATRALTDEDKRVLQDLVGRARQKLTAPVLQVPHEEHRQLHLLIFSRLDNPFVTGLLDAYWDMYEAVVLNMYSGDLTYLNDVWDFHSRMVECICAGDYDGGREALVAHMHLLVQRPA